MSIKKSQITALEQELIAAIRDSDIPFLEKLLHDDLRFMTPNGEVITKAMDLAAHKAGDMTVEELIPEMEDITIIDDIAIFSVIYNTKGSMLGQHIAGRFRYIRFWKQFKDGLKIIGGSCMQVE